MDNHYNIYICGVGGQGIIKTSVIIGEAAMNQGLNVVMSEIHGVQLFRNMVQICCFHLNL